MSFLGDFDVLVSIHIMSKRHTYLTSSGIEQLPEVLVDLGIVLNCLRRQNEIMRNLEQRWSILGSREVDVGHEAESLSLYISKADSGKVNVVEERPRGEGIEGQLRGRHVRSEGVRLLCYLKRRLCSPLQLPAVKDIKFQRDP